MTGFSGGEVAQVGHCASGRADRLSENVEFDHAADPNWASGCRPIPNGPLPLVAQLRIAKAEAREPLSRFTGLDRRTLARGHVLGQAYAGRVGFEQVTATRPRASPSNSSIFGILPFGTALRLEGRPQGGDR